MKSEAQGETMTGNETLQTSLLGRCLESPLILASGSLGEDAPRLREFLIRGAGAVVTRTLRMRTDPMRANFPSPHIAFGPGMSWMMNCEWGNRNGYRYWQREGLSCLVSSGPVIASISGRDLDDCLALAKLLDEAGAMAFEVNFSCSHSSALFGRIGEDPAYVAQAIAHLKKEVATPIIAKLGYSSMLVKVAVAAEDAGADAIATTNAVGPALDVDVETGMPVLGIERGKGGLSGPAILPIALACVADVAQAVKIPVIGVGGVSTGEDVVKMLMCGATAVEVYTAAFLEGPTIFQRMAVELKAYLANHQIRSARDLIGMSLRYLAEPSNLVRQIPNVDTSRCVPCSKCRQVCLEDAICVAASAYIDPDRCVGCGACVYACRTERAALTMSSRGNFD